MSKYTNKKKNSKEIQTLKKNHIEILEMRKINETIANRNENNQNSNERKQKKESQRQRTDTEGIKPSLKITEWRKDKCPKYQDYYQETKFKNSQVSEAWAIN